MVCTNIGSHLQGSGGAGRLSRCELWKPSLSGLKVEVETIGALSKGVSRWYTNVKCKLPDFGKFIFNEKKIKRFYQGNLLYK